MFFRPTDDKPKDPGKRKISLDRASAWFDDLCLMLIGKQVSTTLLKRSPQGITVQFGKSEEESRHDRMRPLALSELTALDTYLRKKLSASEAVAPKTVKGSAGCFPHETGALEILIEVVFATHPLEEYAHLHLKYRNGQPPDAA